MVPERLYGLHTALPTPFDAEGELDLASWERLIAHQLSGSDPETAISGLVIAGTTGEGGALSDKELSKLVASAIEQCNGHALVTVGISANHTEHAVGNAKAAAKMGAQALLCACPAYIKPTQEGLRHHFISVASATDLPLIAYNVPGRTVSDLLPATCAEIFKHEQIIALKDATGDLRRLIETREVCGDEPILLSGDDFTAAPFMRCGGNGAISVVSNVVPRPMARLINAQAGDGEQVANEIQIRLMQLIRELFAEPNPIPVKAALTIQGIFSGDHLRAPLMPASEALRTRLVQALEKLDQVEMESR